MKERAPHMGENQEENELTEQAPSEQRESFEQQETKAEIPLDARLILPPEIEQAKEVIGSHRYANLLYLFGYQQMYGVSKIKFEYLRKEEEISWQKVIEELSTSDKRVRNIGEEENWREKSRVETLDKLSRARGFYDTWLEDNKAKISHRVGWSISGQSKVLEVGAGTSHAKYGQWGQPWLAREIALRKNRVDILATDVEDGFDVTIVRNGEMLNRDEAMKLFNLDPKNQDDWFDWRGKIELWANRSSNSALVQDKKGQWQFEPVTVEGMVESITGISGDSPQDNERDQYDVITSELSECEVFVRPKLDPAFEQLVFGLKVQPGVNHEHLEDYFEKEQFDIIYAMDAVSEVHGGAPRHIVEQRLKNEWEPFVKKPNGEIFVSVGPA